MKNTYKITFNMNTSIAFIEPPTFDGVLSYAHAREMLPGQEFMQKLNIEESEILDFSGMPLVMHRDGYFVASRMFYDDSAAIEDTQRWRKRWEHKHDAMADFRGHVKKVRINAGEFKSYDVPLQVVNIDQAWFYFQSENIGDVQRLVEKRIYFLGKKRSQGYGEIASFTIEESEFDFSTTYRPIPVAESRVAGLIRQGVKVQYTGWRPPYWLPRNHAYCVV